MKKSILTLLVIILSACNTSPSSSTPQPTISIDSPATSTSVPASQTVYNNQKYGYSLTYPDIYQITVVSDEYIEIGSKITVEVGTIDPTAPRGDGALIESTSAVQVSNYPATLLTGYIGSVGGNIPQQFNKIVVERNGEYFMVTLYALGLHVTDGDITQIAQLQPDDVSVFNNIVASMQIP
ncbi:MAG: hypothetical protein U0Z26_00065 [Anaerolineales bacterium]